MTTPKPIYLFNNFKQFNNIIVYEKSDPDYDNISNDYSIHKMDMERLYIQKFIDELRNECQKSKYDTDFVKMVNTFNNFYENYVDDKPNDWLTLRRFTCMLSDILKNLSENIIQFNDSYGFNFQKLYEIYDPSIPLDKKIENVKSALSSDFLSRTVFHQDNEIKYLAKGANGGVNLISVVNGTNKFNVIEKFMLDDSDPVANLFEIIREYIIGTKILIDVRPFTPNFTTVFGMYISDNPLPYEFDKSTIDDYLKKKDRFLKSTLNEYQNIGYYDEIDMSKVKTKNIANINTDKQTLYMMTEYSKGQGFDSFIKKIVKANDVGKAVSIIEILAQVYRSLIFAHNKIKYVHNDIHCANILIYEQSPSIYVDEILNLNNKTHNAQKINHLAQIIDYGYSSIDKYVNYAYYLFSDGKTTVHTDIIRLYTSILKNLVMLRHDGYVNDTLLTITKYITILIGSYYFKDLSSYTMNTNLRDFEDVLIEYEISKLYDNFEYLPRVINERIINKNLNSGYQFYEYFIENMKKSPKILYEPAGFTVATQDQLYDYNKIEKSKLAVPVQDMNIENILRTLQPEGLSTSQYRIIKRSFVDFIQLCQEAEIAYNSITDLKTKVDVIVYLCHNIINFSKYIGLNTLLIYYTKSSNIIPPELDQLFNDDLKNLFIVTSVLYDELDRSSLPFDYKDVNLNVLADFNQYFTL